MTLYFNQIPKIPFFEMHYIFTLFVSLAWYSIMYKLKNTTTLQYRFNNKNNIGICCKHKNQKQKKLYNWLFFS